MEREVGGGIGMGNTCKPMAVSFQYMTKFTTKKKINPVSNFNFKLSGNLISFYSLTSLDQYGLELGTQTSRIGGRESIRKDAEKCRSRKERRGRDVMGKSCSPLWVDCHLFPGYH